MNYMKFSSLMSSVVSSQLQVMSSSMERSIIKAEQLGLPLKEMENLPELLKREQERDPQILAIYVINSQGEILFKTAGAEANQTLTSELILRKALKGKEVNWTAEDPETLFSGLQLYDATQQMMGNIIIAYNKAGYRQTLNSVRFNLIEITLFLFIGFAIMIFMAVRIGFGDVNNVLKIINKQLEQPNLTPETQKLMPGTIAHQFVEQIVQSEKMKCHVKKELDECNMPSHSFSQRGESN